MTNTKLVSMTGFGRVAIEEGGVQLEAEVRTVNSRHFDLNVRLPREYAPFELTLRNDLNSIFSRGRIDVFVTRTVCGSAEAAIALNQATFEAYLSAIQDLATQHGVWDLSFKREVARELLLKRELLIDRVRDVSSEEASVRKVIAGAAEAALTMRKKEGGALHADLKKRISKIADTAIAIGKEDLNRLSEKQKSLRQRIASLMDDGSMEEQRMAQEVSFLVDRLDISEELTRIQSHLVQFTESLNQEQVGRRLEFLLQELGREFNTVGSKAQHATIQQLVVTAKAELERMREQALNIE